MPSTPQQLRGRFSQLSLWIKEWTEGHRSWNAVLHTSLVFGPVNKRSRCHIWAEKCTRAWVLRHMTASWVFLDWSKRREGCTSSLTLFERHFSSWLTSTVVPLTAKASWVGKRFRSRRSQTKGTSRWVSAQVSLLWQMLSFLWPCDLLIYWFMQVYSVRDQINWSVWVIDVFSQIVFSTEIFKKLDFGLVFSLPTWNIEMILGFGNADRVLLCPLGSNQD